MNARVLLAAVGGSIANFLLGWLIYGILLADFMKSNSAQYPGLMQVPPNILYIYLSGFLWSWTFSYIFNRWAGIKDFKSGMMAALAISIPLSLAIDLQLFGMMNLFSGFTPILVDVFASTVIGCTIGGVIGHILGMGNKENATA